MPVNTPRKEVTAALPKWTRCRDVQAGGDAVKAKGELYLPRTSTKQKDPAYQAYKARALFYGATGRTVQGLTGALMAKPPVIQVPGAIEPHLRDVTLSGVPLSAFVQDCVTDVLTVGRIGLLVDMPPVDGADNNTELRPYWIRYGAEDVISWRTTVRNGDTILTRVILRECVEEETKDFEFVSTIQYRVCELLDDGTYQVTIWKPKAKDSDEFIPAESILPVRRGERLTFIPFVFLNPTHLLPLISKPPLLDLVDVNLSHYRSSADLEHAAHYTALPQPWVTGYDGEALEIGSSMAWVFKNADSEVGMLEFKGEGLNTLEKRLEHKEQQMAILGARLLEGQVTKQEAAQTVKLRHAGDAAVLKTIASTAGLGLSQILQWHAWWAGAVAERDNPDISLALHTDFVATRLTAEEIKALTLSLQAGAMSWETYYHNLTRGDMAEPGIDAATERQRIQADEPTPQPELAPTPDDEGDR